jgi:hypothetical protein
MKGKSPMIDFIVDVAFLRNRIMNHYKGQGITPCLEKPGDFQPWVTVMLIHNSTDYGQGEKWARDTKCEPDDENFFMRVPIEAAHLFFGG